MNELVSIVMPSYNTAPYIDQSIKSVISQTYENWELIVVDDCSTDDTEKVIIPFLCDRRIRFIKNKCNQGAAASRNTALRIAEGKWIAFLDSDDLWFPEKLSEQIRFMETNNYHFSYTKYSEIDIDGRLNGIIISGPKRITKTGFFNYCWPGCLTVMYDRYYVGDIQIKEIAKNNDYAMWLNVCQKANCYLLDKELALYRRGRTGSISTNGIKILIKWHYKLFREAEAQSIFMSAFNTARNLVFGFYKKIKYVTKSGE